MPDTTETRPQQISSGFAGEGDAAPAVRRPMFSLDVVDEDEAAEWPEPGGAVSFAPEGADPVLGEGWTEIGYTTDGIKFDPAADLRAMHDVMTEVRPWGVGSATVEFPRVSRETIALALGVDPAEGELWPRQSPILEQLGIPVVESPLVQPGTVLIGATVARAQLMSRVGEWFDVPPSLLAGPISFLRDEGYYASAGTHRDGGAFDVNLAAWRADQRYSMTIRYERHPIGDPPRRRAGWTARRYRAERRAYGRRLRAWKRAGKPTYPTAVTLPHVILDVGSGA